MHQLQTEDFPDDCHHAQMVTQCLLSRTVVHSLDHLRSQDPLPAKLNSAICTRNLIHTLYLLITTIGVMVADKRNDLASNSVLVAILTGGLSDICTSFSLIGLDKSSISSLTAHTRLSIAVQNKVFRMCT